MVLQFYVIMHPYQEMDILTKMCRACNIKKDKLLSIHDIQEPSKLIKSMLEYCLQTTVIRDSKYPKFICYDCLKQLEISYRFIKRFHLSGREFEESYNCLQSCYQEINDGCVSETSGKNDCTAELKNFSMGTFEDSKTVSNAQSTMSINSTPIKIEESFKYNISEYQEMGTSTELCSLCNKTFFTKKALNLHTKLSHKQKMSNI